MARICEECGSPVIPGEGKWLGDPDKPETLRLYHKRPARCARAKGRAAKAQPNARKQLAHAGTAKKGHPRDESGERQQMLFESEHGDL
jgi:hypothetical protein